MHSSCLHIRWSLVVGVACCLLCVRDIVLKVHFGDFCATLFSNLVGGGGYEWRAYPVNKGSDTLLPVCHSVAEGGQLLLLLHWRHVTKLYNQLAMSQPSERLGVATWKKKQIGFCVVAKENFWKCVSKACLHVSWKISKAIPVTGRGGP
jgi:hypothetical protein